MRETITKEMREEEREDKRIIKKVTGIYMKNIVTTNHFWEEIFGIDEAKPYETIYFTYFKNNYFRLQNWKSNGCIKRIGVEEKNGKLEKRWVAVNDKGEIKEEFYEVLNVGDEENYVLMKTSEVNKLTCKVKVHARFEDYDQAKRRMDMLNEVVERCMKGE